MLDELNEIFHLITTPKSDTASPITYLFIIIVYCDHEMHKVVVSDRDLKFAYTFGQYCSTALAQHKAHNHIALLKYRIHTNYICNAHMEIIDILIASMPHVQQSMHTPMQVILIPTSPHTILVVANSLQIHCLR